MTADHPDPLERTLQPYYNQGGRNGPIVVDDWAGAIPQTPSAPCACSSQTGMRA